MMENSLQDLIEFVVKSLVDDPSQVQIRKVPVMDALLRMSVITIPEPNLGRLFLMKIVFIIG